MDGGLQVFASVLCQSREYGNRQPNRHGVTGQAEGLEKSGAGEGKYDA